LAGYQQEAAKLQLITPRGSELDVVIPKGTYRGAGRPLVKLLYGGQVEEQSESECKKRNPRTSPEVQWFFQEVLWSYLRPFK
jgi:hypothetical protein